MCTSMGNVRVADGVRTPDTFSNGGGAGRLVRLSLHLGSSRWWTPLASDPHPHLDFPVVSPKSIGQACRSSYIADRDTVGFCPLLRLRHADVTTPFIHDDVGCAIGERGVLLKRHAERHPEFNAAANSAGISISLWPSPKHTRLRTTFCASSCDRDVCVQSQGPPDLASITRLPRHHI